jgi:hypothetical protein
LKERPLAAPLRVQQQTQPVQRAWPQAAQPPALPRPEVQLAVRQALPLPSFV